MGNRYDEPTLLDWMEPGETVYIEEGGTWNYRLIEATVTKFTKTQITVTTTGDKPVVRRFLLPKYRNDNVVEFGANDSYTFQRPKLMSYMDGQQQKAREHERTMLGRAQSKAQGAAVHFYNNSGQGKWITPDTIVELKKNLDDALALFAEMGVVPTEGVNP